MRKIIIGGLLLVLLSCSSNREKQLEARLAELETYIIEQNKANETERAFDPLAKIGFEEQTILIDEAFVGKAITVEYVIKLEGEAPLIIHDVKTPCGCTVPDWTQTPIAPGETGKLIIKYTPKISDITTDMGREKKAQLITNAGTVMIKLHVKKIT